MFSLKKGGEGGSGKKTIEVGNYKGVLGNIKIKSSNSSNGRAKLWRCLGYKFKSYFGQPLVINTVIYFMHLNLNKLNDNAKD